MISRSSRKQSAASVSRSSPTPHVTHPGCDAVHGCDSGHCLKSSGSPELCNNQDVPPSDLLLEGLITLSQATKYCPRRREGRKVHTTTLARWARWGIRGIRLEVIDTPSGLCTSLASLRRFFDRLSVARDLPRQRPEPLVSEEQHETVEAELARRFRI